MKGKGLHKYAAWAKICFSLIVEVNMISCFMSALQQQDNVEYSALICYVEAFLHSVI